MVAQPEETGPPFKDYCLILQLHPEADGEMVDAAYWHLARRYSDARRTDPSAKAKMDDLNEAYSVLRSPTRREEYFRIRNAVLGEGALPSPPEQVPEAPPLAVMEKQRPKPQHEAVVPEPPVRSWFSFARVSVPSWHNALVAILVLALGGTALVAGAHPGIVVALLAFAVTLAILPLLRRLPGLPTLPTLTLRSLPLSIPRRMPATNRRLDADAIRRSREQIRSRMREGHEAEPSPLSTPPIPQPLTEPPEDQGSGSPPA